jgi:RNA polymerase sigma-70 factor (ECF subfamily)
MEKSGERATQEYLSDERIIDLYWNRDEKAIKATNEKYGKYLFLIAYNILRDKLDCEECLDDTYLGTWRSIPPTKPNVFQVFLARIMRNVALDRFRKKTAARRIPSDLIVSLDEFDECMTYDMSLEEEYLIKEIGHLISEYIRSLLPQDEFIFVCRYYYSDSIVNIAKWLDIDVGDVKKSLLRMRSEIKSIMIRKGYSNE